MGHRHHALSGGDGGFSGARLRLCSVSALSLRSASRPNWFRQPPSRVKNGLLAANSNQRGASMLRKVSLMTTMLAALALPVGATLLAAAQPLWRQPRPWPRRRARRPNLAAGRAILAAAEAIPASAIPANATPPGGATPPGRATLVNIVGGDPIVIGVMPRAMVVGTAAATGLMALARAGGWADTAMSGFASKAR